MHPINQIFLLRSEQDLYPQKLYSHPLGLYHSPNFCQSLYHILFPLVYFPLSEALMIAESSTHVWILHLWGWSGFLCPCHYFFLSNHLLEVGSEVLTLRRSLGNLCLTLVQCLARYPSLSFLMSSAEIVELKVWTTSPRSPSLGPGLTSEWSSLLSHHNSPPWSHSPIVGKRSWFYPQRLGRHAPVTISSWEGQELGNKCARFDVHRY